MQPHFSVCCFSLLFIHFIGAKPISDIQEAQVEESDVGSDGSVLGAAGRREPWSAADRRRTAPLAKDNALARFLKDIMTSSKRSWSRYKKGGLRSCFGVRLERIGSFSGLGC
ncbi:natriuretic peptide A-like isoform X2 [Poecilia reticulata]|uniref:natriuretic peptide A-like isoform X2 n=1 Tax=Poecilia reticulata TaxID=8081 RepID=UPI0004A255F9|nr:PREDICTED: C-type natriuretic peptide 3-like isoform X2 [Poecilia reticulata]